MLCTCHDLDGNRFWSPFTFTCIKLYIFFTLFIISFLPRMENSAALTIMIAFTSLRLLFWRQVLISASRRRRLRRQRRGTALPSVASLSVGVETRAADDSNDRKAVVEVTPKKRVVTKAIIFIGSEISNRLPLVLLLFGPLYQNLWSWLLLHPISYTYTTP